jgi:hypothetical protein
MKWQQLLQNSPHITWAKQKQTNQWLNVNFIRWHTHAQGYKNENHSEWHSKICSKDGALALDVYTYCWEVSLSLSPEVYAVSTLATGEHDKPHQDDTMLRSDRSYHTRPPYLANCPPPPTSATKSLLQNHFTFNIRTTHEHGKWRRQILSVWIKPGDRNIEGVLLPFRRRGIFDFVSSHWAVAFVVGETHTSGPQMKIHFVPHRKHITSPLQSPTG